MNARSQRGSRRWGGRQGAFWLLVFCCVFPLWREGLAQESESDNPRYFVYVSDKRIITAELTEPSKVILNYINLSDVIELIEAQGFLVIDQEGVGYRGHLFLREEVAPDQNRYFVNDLVKPDQFSAYDLLGNFHFKAPPRRVLLQLGSRIAELEAIDSSEFDVFAGKVSNIDFSLDSKTAVMEAGFWRGQGSLYLAGEKESDAITSAYPRSDPAPPVLLEAPQPHLLPKFHDLAQPVVVQVKVLITDAGGILNPTVTRGINDELDQLAVKVVMNSWKVLPAIAENKPVGAETVLNVQFQR